MSAEEPVPQGRIVIDWVVGHDPTDYGTYEWGLTCEPKVPDNLVAGGLAQVLQVYSYRPEEPSFLVRGFLTIAEVVRAVSPYRLLTHWNKRPTAAEWYVLTWLAVLAAALIGVRISVIGDLAFGLACFRWVNLTVFQAAIVLDRSRGSLRSYPRTVVLTSLNLVELTLITAIAACWRLHIPAGTAIYDGFNVVLARSTVLDQGPFMKTTAALVIISALILLVGLLAMIVGVIGQSLKESPSTPTR